MQGGNTRRLRAIIAYDGTEFHGWQVQPGLPTIQGAVQAVLAGIENAPVHVAGSGRTDAGVHALGQVAAFTLANPIPVENLRRAMNHLLPTAIRVLEISETAPDFDPRRHAKAKTYEYRIVRSEVCSPFERRFVHHHPYPLDVAAMQRVTPLLEGTHNFSAFAAADERDEAGASKVRTIFSSTLIESPDRLTYRVRGNGFLKYMVRNIVGTLIEAGKGNLDESALRALLAPPAGRKAGSRAPACGLFLVGVEY